MTTILLTLSGIILSLLLLLLLVLLFSPWVYSLTFSYRGDLRAAVSLKILPLLKLKASFQEYRFETAARVFGIKIRLPARLERKRQKTPEKKGFPFSFRLATRENLHHFLGLFHDIYRILRPRVFQIRGRVGLEPHYTAWLLAGLSLLPLGLKEAIRLEPVWDDELVEVEGRVEGRFLLGLVLLRALRFLASQKTLRIYRELKQKKKRASPAT